MKIQHPNNPAGRKTYGDLESGDVLIYAEAKHQDGNYRMKLDEPGYVIFGDNVAMDKDVYPANTPVYVFPDATLVVGRRG